MEQLSPNLSHNRERLAQALTYPENIGIIFRDLTLRPGPVPDALLIWVDGLCSAGFLATQVLAPLDRITGPDSAGALARQLPVPRTEVTRDSAEVLEAVLMGHAALLAEGWGEALLLDTADWPAHSAGNLSPTPRDDIFGRDLHANIALLRKRLRDPALVAQRVALRNPRAGHVALLYMKGRAEPRLVRAVRRWAGKHLGEEAASRGLPTGFAATIGFLPRFDLTRWPDKAATLLDSGCAVLLVDRAVYAYIAPVTAAGMNFSASDYSQVYPMRRWFARTRLALYLTVLLLPGSVLAVMNYHQEMVPTSFVLALASTRETAPFATFFEILFVELTVEVAREASFRLPVALPIGAAALVTVGLITLAVFSGLVGPATAMAGALGAIASLALPDMGGTYLVRVWRIVLLVASVILGFFAMAAVFTALLIYLCQARSWGVPFLGPSGFAFSAPESDAARRPRSRGGKRSGKAGAGVR